MESGRVNDVTSKWESAGKVNEGQKNRPRLVWQGITGMKKVT